MSAHMPGCVWDAGRQCYTTMAAGCAAPEEHAKWRHPTFCAGCGEQIVYREEQHRCAPPGSETPPSTPTPAANAKED